MRCYGVLLSISIQGYMTQMIICPYVLTVEAGP